MYLVSMAAAAPGFYSSLVAMSDCDGDEAVHVWGGDTKRGEGF